MSFLRIHAQPGRSVSLVLSWFLFASGITAYFYASAARHRDNPDDRVTPTIAQMVQGFRDAASKPAPEHEDLGDAPQTTFARIQSSMLWTDTAATSRRFLISVALLFPAVLIGLHMAMFPYVGAFFLRFFQFFDKIVALSLLPIIFIAFGIDELSKVMLIVIGVAPTIILDTFNLTKSVPSEQIVKAFTLGAGDFAIAYRIAFRQIMPRVLNSIRLNLKSVMLFLFAGEMIAASDGLAIRIRLMQRQMGMDTIIPYVLWVALLLFLVDLGMNLLNRKLHPWFEET
ncbi:MAG TPA: ABC transporter permease subunit [Bryobacteraceae bacterium]|jgi:NitT/TauT family transport system permease protein